MEDVHTQKVESILLKDDFPIVGSLTEVEFHSMLNKKLRMHQITSDQQKQIIDKFNEHLRTQLFEMLPITDTVYHTTRWILSKTEYPIRTLDSLHLTFSITNRLTLFSTDKVLLYAGHGFKSGCCFRNLRKKVYSLIKSQLFQRSHPLCVYDA